MNDEVSRRPATEANEKRAGDNALAAKPRPGKREYSMLRLHETQFTTPLTSRGLRLIELLCLLLLLDTAR
jgi:hypothetical protein